MDLIEQTKSGYILAHCTSSGEDQINIADDKKMMFKNGIFRAKFADGESCYGLTTLPKKIGEFGKEWHLNKYTNGDITYEDYIKEYGKDSELVTRYKFDANSLEWNKVN